MGYDGEIVHGTRQFWKVSPLPFPSLEFGRAAQLLCSLAVIPWELGPNLVVGDADPSGCTLASLRNAPCHALGLLSVGEAEGYALPLRADPSPSTFHGRPPEQVGLYPEVIVTRYVSRRVNGLPMP